jgi:hypothetical protein
LLQFNGLPEGDDFSDVFADNGECGNILISGNVITLEGRTSKQERTDGLSFVF